jgi:3-deoxy-manno-octulosonate cytidylyltransferase (CMP-KDO synthetase)
VHAAIAVIPARYESTRFPGKPLANRTGRPLIQHVSERAAAAKRIGRVIVATDDERIAEVVRGYGGESVMTRRDHLNGTSRIAEAIEAAARNGSIDPECLIVNVQGDEPEIDPALIDLAVDTLVAHPDCPVATVAAPFPSCEDPADPNIVKVVCDTRGRALYFSRALIPCRREGRSPAGPRSTPLQHLGLYVYRRPFLREYVRLCPTPLEQAEQLEQLRILEHGFPVMVACASVPPAGGGIDTPEQYEAFVRRFLSGGA